METIKCTSCGAIQEVSSENPNCEFCGSKIEVNKSKEFYDEVAKGEFGNFLIMAETAEEATNYDEAMNYYNRILENDTTYADAWLGKGNCTIYSSKIGDIKMNQGLAYWKNAIKFADNKEPMKLRVGKEINNVVQTFFPNLLNHYKQFDSLDDSYAELVSRFLILEGGIDYACQLCPDESDFFQTGYDLCEEVIEAPGAEASAAISGARASVFINALSGNEYAAKRNQDEVNKAKERKNQILSFGKKIVNVKNKYLEGLIRLGIKEEGSIGKDKVRASSNNKNPQINKLINEFYISIVVTVVLTILPLLAGGVPVPAFIIVWVIYYFVSLNKRSKRRFGVPFKDLFKLNDDN